MKRHVRLLAFSVGLLAVPGTAMAQDIGDNSAIVIAPQLAREDAAGARFEPEFSPQPILSGPLVINASLSMAGGYDTNVRDADDSEGDAVATLTPRIQLRANTQRHLAQITAIGNFRRFTSLSTENSESYALTAQTRLDFADNNSVFANGGFRQEIEPRSSLGTIADAAEPVSYRRVEGQIGAQWAFGALSLRPSAHFEESDYADLDLLTGTSTDQSFRDTRRLGGDLAIGYQLSGLLSAFTAASYDDTESVNPAPNAARDAQDWSVVAGLRGELGPLITAQVSAGYRSRDFALGRYLDFEGLTYRADVQWFVTPLVTLRFEASQNFLNSGNTQVAGILSNRFSVSGYYDPLRNLRLAATATFEHNEFRETDTTASRPSLQLQAQYRLNRHVAVGGFAGMRNQDVSGAAIVQDFNSFSAGFGVTLTP